MTSSRNASFHINTLRYNGNRYCFSDISQDDREIVKNLVEKKSIGIAMLYLNENCKLKSINGVKVNNLKGVNDFLKECDRLLENRKITLANAKNFRPLANVKGLEIMENKNKIIFGKGDVLFEECEGTQCSDIAEKKDQDVGGGVHRPPKVYRPKRKRGKSKKVIDENKSFTPSNIDIYVKNYNKKTGQNKNEKDFDWQFMAGKVDGMKIKGDKRTHMFDINSGEYLGDYDKYMSESNIFNVPKNHGFKGFMLKESGLYERGNFVLINENGKIKAVCKKKLSENYKPDESVNSNTIQRFIDKLSKVFDRGLKELGYDEEFQKDYCFIESDIDEHNRLHISIRAELSYEEFMEIADKYLDDFIKSIDDEAYFDAYDHCIYDTYINIAKLVKANI